MTGRCSKASSAVSISESRASTSSGISSASRIGRLEFVGFGSKRFARRRLLVAQRLAFALEMAKPIGVAVGKIRRDLDPFPPLGANRFGVAFELLGDEPIEQAGVLQPAAVVVLEEIAHDRAAGGDIVLAHILRALVGGADGAPR